MQVIYAPSRDARSKAGGKPRAGGRGASGSSSPSPSDDRSSTVALRSQLLVPVFLVSQAGELIRLEIILVGKKKKKKDLRR